VSKFSDSYKEFGDLQDREKIEMWTYTGTVAFSAPEIFSGEGYKYEIYYLAKWLICGVLAVSFIQCYQVNYPSYQISNIMCNLV
jgi:hypothetical protein